MTSVVYNIFGNTREVLANYGGSVVVAQNCSMGFGEERYQMKENGFGKTIIWSSYSMLSSMWQNLLAIPVPSYKARILSLSLSYRSMMRELSRFQLPSYAEVRKNPC